METVINIHLPLDLAPWAFYCETGRLSRLGKKAVHCLEKQNLTEAERWAAQANQLATHSAAPVEQADALLLMSDIHRRRKNLDAALSDGQEAHRLLSNQPAQAQRFNQAVAAYNLGLLHHLQDHIADALYHYQQALQLCTVAQTFWAAHKDRTLFQHCAQFQDWVQTLIDSLLDREESSGQKTTDLLPTRLPNGHWSLLAVTTREPSGYVLDQHLAIDHQSYRAYALRGSSVVIPAGSESRIFEIPETACRQIGAQPGDWVLAQQTEEKDPTIPYYVLQAAGGPEFGRFKRTSAGNVVFESTATGRTIGDIDFPVYFPLALLRPTKGD